MTTDFLEHCAMNFIRVVLRTPNCSTIQQFEDLVNFWAFKNNADFGWYKVRIVLELVYAFALVSPFLHVCS